MAPSHLQSLRQFSAQFPRRSRPMPVLFIGHGSPMNGIEDNAFSRGWRDIVKGDDLPSAVVVVSAHWLTRGTWVTAMEAPRTIHDFGGFPPALYQVQYPAPGAPDLAHAISNWVESVPVHPDHEWGLDHGTWAVVRHMFPDAQVPVVQVSIDYHQPGQWHYDLGVELAELRHRGVLVIGSGNMVHNLRMVAWDKLGVHDFGFDWAREMHEIFKQKITDRAHTDLVDYQAMGEAARLAVPTPDHYFPLLYVLGMTQPQESPNFFNDVLVGGSLNMTSVKFG
jgi:4,5-DOPA dioxygenase extradiol